MIQAVRPRMIVAWLLLGVISQTRAYTQAQQEKVHNTGAQLFASRCAFCHGADGKGGRAPAIAVLPQVIAMSDQELRDIVHDGKTSQGMPAFPDLSSQDTAAVVGYLRQLQGAGTVVRTRIIGDPHMGQELFFGSGQCSTCHMVAGKGGFIAEDLTGYARTLSVDAIVAAILHPDAHLNPTQQVVEVRTREGDRLTGVMRSEDNLTVILQTRTGRYYVLKKNSLQKIHYTGHSLMPEDYGRRMSRAQLDDIAAYLVKAARTPEDATTPEMSRSRGSDEK